MSSKEQLCAVCGSWIPYPEVDMVILKGDIGVGNAHLECAWQTRNEN